tara:strand:+ start:938 stop:1573 length:636 start_codon:yes stop_codon:yes gene_type:complete
MTDIEKLMGAVAGLNETDGVTQKGGKKYTEVAKRVEVFRKHLGFKYTINTNIILDNEKRVVMKAQIFDLANTALPIGEGYAEEIRGSSLVNKTSPIENCETSAIGRALASLGLHGGQYASVNEIEKAENNEKNIDENKKEIPKVEEKKTDWVQYVAQQTQNIKNMKSISALSGWANSEKINLEDLAKADNAKWEALFNMWSAKNKEIENNG